MHVFLRLLVLVLVVQSVGFAAKPKKGTELRYRVQQGNEYKYTMTMTNEISSPLLPKPIGSTLSSAFGIKTTSTTEQQIGLEFAYSALSIATTGAEAMGRRDTTIDVPMGEEAKLSVIVDRKGALLLAWPTGALVTAYETGARLGNGGIQNAVRKLFFVYPDSAVRKGDTWSTVLSDTTSPGEGQLVTRMKNTMTFEGLVDTLGVSCARVSLRSDSVAISGRSLYMGATMNVQGSGTAQGVYYVEATSGMIVAHAMDTAIDMQLIMEQQENTTVTMRTMSSVLVARVTGKQ